MKHPPPKGETGMLTQDLDFCSAAPPNLLDIGVLTAKWNHNVSNPKQRI